MLLQRMPLTQSIMTEKPKGAVCRALFLIVRTIQNEE